MALKHPEYASGISNAELVKEALEFCDEELSRFEGMDFDSDSEVCCQRSETFIRELVRRFVDAQALGAGALRAIANLPTTRSLGRETGREDAYRAVEGLFKVPPRIEKTSGFDGVSNEKYLARSRDVVKDLRGSLQAGAVDQLTIDNAVDLIVDQSKALSSLSTPTSQP